MAENFREGRAAVALARVNGDAEASDWVRRDQARMACGKTWRGDAAQEIWAGEGVGPPQYPLAQPGE